MLFVDDNCVQWLLSEKVSVIGFFREILKLNMVRVLFFLFFKVK